MHFKKPAKNWKKKSLTGFHTQVFQVFYTFSSSFLKLIPAIFTCLVHRLVANYCQMQISRMCQSIKCTGIVPERLLVKKIESFKISLHLNLFYRVL